MKKFLKIFLLAAALVLVLSLISCGNSASNPDDTGGTWGDISWKYTKGDHTLTLVGSGDVPNATASEDVPWYSVRSAVTNVKFEAKDGEAFTSVGDYAFYGMVKLEEIQIPAGVESLGKCSLAFCSSLEDVTLPDTLTEVGESSFEACVALESISLPTATIDIGDSAFAFCRGLTTVTLNGVPEKIGKWTFRDCVALESLRMDGSATVIDADAFEGATIGADDIKSLRTSVVSVSCKDADGNVIGGDGSVAVLELGEEKEISAPSIDGYELASGGAQTVVGNGEPITVEFIYSKLAVEDSETESTTEAPAEDADGEEEDDGVNVMAIVAVIIFAVVIIAIIIGAIFLIRSDANMTKDSMTVRKNKNGNKGDGKTQNNKNNAKKGKKK